MTAVPEPTTWAMLLAGLCCMGLVLKRQPARVKKKA
ncbi:PEPxxWA-CTERM sorting domain-containing protein [Massilia sp. BJB1822]